MIRAAPQTLHQLHQATSKQSATWYRENGKRRHRGAHSPPPRATGSRPSLVSRHISGLEARGESPNVNFWDFSGGLTRQRSTGANRRESRARFCPVGEHWVCPYGYTYIRQAPVEVVARERWLSWCSVPPLAGPRIENNTERERTRTPRGVGARERGERMPVSVHDGATVHDRLDSNRLDSNRIESIQPIGEKALTAQYGRPSQSRLRAVPGSRGLCGVPHTERGLTRKPLDRILAHLSSGGGSGAQLSLRLACGLRRKQRIAAQARPQWEVAVWRGGS